MLTNVEEIQDFVVPTAETLQQIRNAQMHVSRCKSHSEGITDDYIRQEYTYAARLDTSNTAANYNYYAGRNYVLAKAYAVLPHDKFMRFISFLSMPSVGIIERFKKEMNRVFTAQNGYEHYEFESEQAEALWREYRQKIAEGVSDVDFWSDNAVSMLIANFNDVVVCDAKTYDDGTIQPYYYVVSVNQLVNVKANRKGIKKLLFKADKDEYIYIDKHCYARLDETRKIIEIIEHELGYTPCRFVSNEVRFQDNYIERKGLISPYLDQMDYLCFFDTNKRFSESVAGSPILWKYKDDCTYKSADLQDFRCDSMNCSYTPLGSDLPVFRKCMCKDKGLIGAGTLIECPMPVGDVIKDIAPPAGVISVDSASLEFLQKETERLKEELYNVLIGGAGVDDTSKSLNEMQVQATFEGQASVLSTISQKIEKLWNWANNTCGYIVFGETFTGKVVLGDEFYLITGEKLNTDFANAKSRGDLAVQESLENQILMYDYRTDSQALNRAKIVNDLVPFPFQSIAELLEMQKLGIVSSEEIRFTMKLPVLIQMFEQENVPLVEFGTALPYSEKISRIKKYLYIKFKQHEQQTQEDGGSNNAANDPQREPRN